MKFASRLDISPSATLEMNARAMAKKSRGERVFNLSAGEPMVCTPQVIIDAAIQAMRHGKTHYTAVAGISELRDAACTWMNTTYASQFSSAETFVTNGGKFGCYALCQSFLNPGDEAIVIAPYWVSYSSMIELAGGNPVVVQTSESNNWKVELDNIEAAISERTRFLFFNNGSNPTGVLYSGEEIQQLLALCQSKNVLVVSDEVYSGLVYDGERYISCASFPEYRDIVIVVHSASKNFAMTGWRLGLVFGQQEVIQKLSTLQGQSTSNTSSITQWAGVAAYSNAAEIIPRIQESMLFRRNAFVSTCSELFGIPIVSPKSAIYCFLHMKSFGVKETDSVAFCRRALDEGNVALVPGAAFAAEGYVRFSFGADESEIHQALHQFHDFVMRIA